MTTYEDNVSFGMTDEAMARVLTNAQRLVRRVLDDAIDPEGVDTGWRDWLRDNDMDVPDDARPSDVLGQYWLHDDDMDASDAPIRYSPANVRLFMRVISDDTYYGGMTTARRNVRRLSEGKSLSEDQPIDRMSRLKRENARLRALVARLIDHAERSPHDDHEMSECIREAAELGVPRPSE